MIIFKDLKEAGLFNSPNIDFAPKEYQRYNDEEAIKEMLQKGLIVSCVTLKNRNNSVFAIEGFRRDGKESLREIKMLGTRSAKSIGLWYTDFEITSEVITVDKKSLMDEMLESACLLLPYAQKDSDFLGQFTVITSKWEVLQRDGSLNYPKHCPDLFKSFNRH